MTRRDEGQGDAVRSVGKDDIGHMPVERGASRPAGDAPRGTSNDLVDGRAPSTPGGVDAAQVGDVPVRSGAVPRPETATGSTEQGPRTMEKPGTGSPREPGNDFPYTREKQPVPGQEQRYPPRPERERPTGQITDESGEYGPERTWYDGDGETDWNKMNRAPSVKQVAPRKAPTGTGIPPAAYIIGGAIALGLGLGVLSRPAPTIGSAATNAASATASAQAPAAGDTYEMGPINVRRDPNSTTSRYTVDVSVVPPGDYRWTLDAPCGGIGATQLSALVGWSYDNNTKTCPPGPQGPFPGKVTLTYTATDGRVYTWSAGSETGSYGEKTKITIKK